MAALLPAPAAARVFRADWTSVRALTQALRTDSDTDVRHAAAWILGRLEVHAATAALCDALTKDAAVEVKRTAAWALGQMGDASEVSAPGQALKDSDREVRRTSVWVLVRGGMLVKIDRPLRRLYLFDPEAGLI